MESLCQKVQKLIAEATQALATRWPQRPKLGLILGSGLAPVAKLMGIQQAIPFEQIPGLAAPEVPGHPGQVVCGHLGPIPAVAFQGRIHLYEGHPAWKLALPVWVMRRWGCRLLVVVSAVGGLNPLLSEGQLVVLTDYINLQGTSPLVGLNHPSMGQVFPSMHEPFWHWGVQQALRVARRLNLPLAPAVYVAMRGPNLETRAEYRFLRRIGGDVVGMSTVPEVIAAAQCRLPVLGFAVVGNLGLPDALRQTSHQHILHQSAQAASRLALLLQNLLVPEVLQRAEKSFPD